MILFDQEILRTSLQVADAVRNILETQEHDNATLSQTQFKLLNQLMKEVNRLIDVHCSETADMVHCSFLLQIIYLFTIARPPFLTDEKNLGRSM